VRLGEWEEATTKFKLIRRTSLTSSVSSDGTFGFIWLILNRSVKRSSHNLAIRQFDCNYILFTTRKHFFISVNWKYLYPSIAGYKRHFGPVGYKLFLLVAAV
jgi:hypothetical protein